MINKNATAENNIVRIEKLLKTESDVVLSFSHDLSDWFLYSSAIFAVEDWLMKRKGNNDNE